MENNHDFTELVSRFRSAVSGIQDARTRTESTLAGLRTRAEGLGRELQEVGTQVSRLRQEATDEARKSREQVEGLRRDLGGLEGRIGEAVAALEGVVKKCRELQAQLAPFAERLGRIESEQMKQGIRLGRNEAQIRSVEEQFEAAAQQNAARQEASDRAISKQAGDLKVMAENTTKSLGAIAGQFEKDEEELRSLREAFEKTAQQNAARQEASDRAISKHVGELKTLAENTGKVLKAIQDSISAHNRRLEELTRDLEQQALSLQIAFQQHDRDIRTWSRGALARTILKHAQKPVSEVGREAESRDAELGARCDELESALNRLRRAHRIWIWIAVIAATVAIGISAFLGIVR